MRQEKSILLILRSIFTRNKIIITKYQPENSRLKTIDFVWHFTSDKPIHNAQLLPVCNTDLIINTSSPIYYSSISDTEKNAVPAPSVHIRNVKLSSQYITQNTPIDVWGVSLMPFTPYFLLNENMEKYRESILDLNEIVPEIGKSLINSDGDLSSIINKNLNIDKYKYEIEIMMDFLENISEYHIGEYCNMKKINIKYLERTMKKFTGYTPKQIQQVIRFQKSSNDFIYSKSDVDISDVAYSNDYTDQMHLTKDFKRYTATTPFFFRKEKNTVKEKINDGTE